MKILTVRYKKNEWGVSSMKNNIGRAVTILFAALCFIAAIFPVFAQDPENGTGGKYRRGAGPVGNI